MYYHHEFIRPRYEETDQMGIIYHGNYIIWFEQARSGFFRSIGYPYSVLEKEGLWMPVIEVGCQYFAPAKYDEEVYVKTSIKAFKGVRVTLNYDVYDKATETLLVSGFTKHAITDHEMKPVNLKKKNIKAYELFKGCMD